MQISALGNYKTQLTINQPLPIFTIGNFHFATKMPVFTDTISISRSSIQEHASRNEGNVNTNIPHPIQDSTNLLFI